MLNVLVLVSGGGTNLQAIVDSIADGRITDTRIVGVISNNPNAYALERAKAAGIPEQCISPKNFGTREEFEDGEVLSARFDCTCGIFSCDSSRDDCGIQK